MIVVIKSIFAIKLKTMKQVLLLPLLLISQYFYGQSPQLVTKWSEIHAFKGVGGNVYSGLIGTTLNHYYYAEVNTLGKPELVTYDYNHKPVKRGDLEISVNGNRAQIKAVKTTRNNAYAFSEYDDNLKDVGYIYAHKISADGKIDPGATVILDKSKKMSLSSNNRVVQSLVGGQGSSIRLFESPDSSLLANIATSSAGSGLLYLTVFDESLNKKWEREIALSSKFAEKELSITDPYLANDGRVFFIGTASDKNYRHKKITGTLHPVLFIADDKGIKEIDLDYSPKVAIEGIQIISVNGNEVILGGLYNIEYDCGGGAVVIKADIESGKIVSYKEQPIKIEDLDFGKKSMKKKGCVEWTYLVDCTTLSDGTIIISAAQGLSSQTYDKLFFAFANDLTPKYTFGMKGWASSGPSPATIPLGNNYAIIYVDNESRNNVLAIFVNEKGEKSEPHKLPCPKMFLDYVKKIDNKRILVTTTGGNVGVVKGNYQIGVLTVK